MIQGKFVIIILFRNSRPCNIHLIGTVQLNKCQMLRHTETNRQSRLCYSERRKSRRDKFENPPAGISMIWVNPKRRRFQTPMTNHLQKMRWWNSPWSNLAPRVCSWTQKIATRTTGLNSRPMKQASLSFTSTSQRNGAQVQVVLLQSRTISLLCMLVLSTNRIRKMCVETAASLHLILLSRNHARCTSQTTMTC